jgi:hypothetical protein
MRGRKPKPTHLKPSKGSRASIRCGPTSRSRPLARGLPDRRVISGARRRKERKRVARMLHGAGLLTPLDERALLGYCVHYARWVEAQGEIANIGTVIRAAYHLMRAPLETYRVNAQPFCEATPRGQRE